jgi:type II secretory pathway pseudopilin PulG
MNRGRGITLIEMLVIVSIVALAIGILLPALSSPRRAARQSGNSTQLRGIHQGLILYSQGFNGWYAGLDGKGQPIDLRVEARMVPLVNGNYFIPGYLINPAETDQNIQTWDGSSPLTANNWSYAGLQVPADGGRYKEWRDTRNPKALMLSDRNTGRDYRANVTSIWTNAPGDWRGLVVFNDNSTQFALKHRTDVDYDSTTTKDDNIFEKLGDDDAYVVREGNE